MNKENYLGMIEKLNLLINNKLLEKEELLAISTRTTAVYDGMPHAKGVSDKVGNGVIRMLEKEEEIACAIDLFYGVKMEIIGQLQKLDKEEYEVLYKLYVQGKSLAEVADEKERHVDTIKNIRKRGIKNLVVLESEKLHRACGMLFQAA